VCSSDLTLAGPAAYQTDTAKNGAMEGTMYIDMPVANVLRSTATAGAIRVKISAPGLEPAEVTLASVAPPDDRVAGITEPPVADQGRVRVTRIAGFHAVALAAKPSSKNMVAEIPHDYDFAKADIRGQLEKFVQERNPKLDTSTAAYKAFIDRMTQIATERGGHLVADDYNFAARAYTQPPAAPKAGARAPDPREAERARIKSTLHVPSPLPPLAVERYGQFEPAPGVVAERVSYATDYGLRVPAIVYRPKDVPAGKMPGIVVVNGHGGDKYSWYAFYAGILYARAGAAVLTYDPIGEGERNLQRKDGSRQHDRNVDPPDMARRTSGLMLTDLMQATSYLAARPDVDARRLAAVGYSMGSFVLGIGCAIETRLNACVLAGGGNLDGPGGYWDSSSKRMCQAIPYQSLMFLGDRGAALYDLHAARGSTLLINGTADDVVSMPKMGAAFFDDLRRRTIALHGSSQNVFDVMWQPGGGHRPYFLTRPAALWLQQRLHFAHPMDQLGETHISEWAARNNVFVDKLYATELREGGTRAMDTDIPSVPHDLLNSLPPDRWERDKDKYIYETWLKEAKAALR
jgi:dienelactone hydrolase